MFWTWKVQSWRSHSWKLYWYISLFLRYTVVSWQPRDSCPCHVDRVTSAFTVSAITKLTCFHAGSTNFGLCFNHASENLKLTAQLETRTGPTLLHTQIAILVGLTSSRYQCDINPTGFAIRQTLSLSHSIDSQENIPSLGPDSKPSRNHIGLISRRRPRK